MTNRILVVKCAVILGVIPALMYSYASGPRQRSSGAPDGQTCLLASCHTGSPLNENGNKIELTFEGGINYVPGQQQRITIRVTEPQNGPRGVFGFQMTARLVSDETSQAGRFITAESNTEIICANGGSRDNPPLDGTCPAGQTVEFIEHSAPKSVGEWLADWAPPATDAGPVRFYIAASVANGDGQNTGDKIYTANFTLTPSARSTRPKK